MDKMDSCDISNSIEKKQLVCWSSVMWLRTLQNEKQPESVLQAKNCSNEFIKSVLAVHARVRAPCPPLARSDSVESVTPPPPRALGSLSRGGGAVFVRTKCPQYNSKHDRFGVPRRLVGPQEDVLQKAASMKKGQSPSSPPYCSYS
ncbi:hypothetical protein SRHO_G00027260 [Serrasalmus rhombeus]